MSIKICPPIKRLFAEELGGKPLSYTPPQLAKEFVAYIQDINDNPMEIETIYKRRNKKERLQNNEDNETEQNRVEWLPRAPRISDFVTRWLGKTMAWWYSLSNGEIHSRSDEYFIIKGKIQTYCRNAKLNGAVAGVFNPVIIARELGLTEKSQVEQTVKQITISVNSEEEAERMKSLGGMA